MLYICIRSAEYDSVSNNDYQQFLSPIELIAKEYSTPGSLVGRSEIALDCVN